MRGKLYELLANCIPPELLLRALLLELLKKLDDELKVGPACAAWLAWSCMARAACMAHLGPLSPQPEAAALAALYEHRLQEGQKAIFHLEAFVAKFMSAYKNWQIAAFG